MKTIAATACLLVMALALSPPALAQSAVACGCYCGITISPPCSEQACKAACGWSEGRRGGGGNGSGPAQVWYCRALSRTGGSGWAWSGNLDQARQSALRYCQQYGRPCTIEACRINDPSLARAPTTTRRGSAGTSTRDSGRTTAQQGWCDLCTRKLEADVRAGWASALVRSYVGQAIAGYQNCTRRAGGTCPRGDRAAANLRACSRFMFDAYRACLDRAF